MRHVPQHTAPPPPALRLQFGGTHAARGVLVLVFAAALLLGSCRSTDPAPSLDGGSDAPTFALYDWDGDFPESLLALFGEEQGVAVRRALYESQEEAIASLRAGGGYDVVVMDSRLVSGLIRDGLLAEIDYRHVPNRKNLSAAFLSPASDPGSRYSVPFSFGTTGVVARSDLVTRPVTRWTDLWDPAYRGKVGVWVGTPREVLALTLKSLGRSANSEDPAEVEAAVQRFLALAPYLVALEDYDPATSAGALASGEVVLAMGYAADLQESRGRNAAVSYILPQDGALLWNDALVIPVRSTHKELAAAFLNFVLRADVAVRYVEETHYAVPNEAAMPLLRPEVRDDPSLFPPAAALRQAEPLLPLSADGTRLWEGAQERMMAAVPRRSPR